ncbi:MAG: 1-acyl-sn-glycerol-3-phosphate acyltransferase, partial [Verrucomicrobiota bacterium]
MHRSEYPDHPLVHRLDQSWVERIDVRSPESWSYDGWNTARYPMNDPRYLFLKWTISPFLRALWSRRVGGTEHLPKHGPCIVIANHASYLDFLILGSLFQSLRRRQLYFWANSKVMKHPVWRFLAHPAECIEVQSTGHHRNLWTRSRAYLERNRC